MARAFAAHNCFSERFWSWQLVYVGLQLPHERQAWDQGDATPSVSWVEHVTQRICNVTHLQLLRGYNTVEYSDTRSCQALVAYLGGTNGQV